MRVALMIAWATGFAVFLIVLVATVLRFRRDQKELRDFRFMDQPPPPDTLRSTETVVVDGEYVRFWDRKIKSWRWCHDDDQVQLSDGNRIKWNLGQTPDEYAEKLRRHL